MATTLTLKQIKFKIKGLTPTIMHNGQLADPLNEFAKAMRAISSKRKKTDSDHEDMALIEWSGSLYVDAQDRIIWPGYVLEGALVNAAKKLRLGDPAKAGISVEEDAVLEYKGAKNLDVLKKDANFRISVGVRVQTSRVIRTRPIFKEWGLTFVITYDPEILNAEQVIQIVEVLGQRVGLSDWRPRYGRFQVEKAEQLD